MARVSDCGGRPTPRNKEPPHFGRSQVSSIASSEELKFGCTSGSQSLVSTYRRIDTDTKGMDIDCGFESRHNIDPESWHIWYRHRCLSSRQHNHQVTNLYFGRTILVGIGITAGIDVVPGVIAGPMDGQKVPDSGIALALMSRPVPSLSVSLLLSSFC